jgi:hypothetical protein
VTFTHPERAKPWNDDRHRTDDRRVNDRLVSGAAIGAVAGVLVDVFGVLGLALLVVVIAVSALVPPRFAFLGGVLISAGGLWLFFSLQAAAICAVNPSSCSGPSPVPFAAVSGLAFASGILVLAKTRPRPNRSHDIRER